jgi:hypothetical protein
MAIKEYSPFQPGIPVKPGKFVGREQQIEEIDRYLKQVRAGRFQSVFLIGDRGLGKTSLATFIQQYAERQYNLLGIHTFLGGVSTLDEIVKRIFDELLKRSEKESWSKKVKALFGKNIEEVGMFGINIKFNPPAEKLQELRKNFPDALSHFLDALKGERSGLLIILDDINGTLDNEGFANWFKSLADKVAVSASQFPVFFLLIGLPEKRNQLFAQQPSLMRIFQILEIERLSDEEIRNFFIQAFGDANMTVENKALEMMVEFSSGLPVLMHEIGDAVFWADSDGNIDQKDVAEGIAEAANRIGRKYLDPTFFNAVRSPRYKAIIRTIGKRLQFEFSKADIEKELKETEKKVIHNFLQKMKQLGIISQPSDLPRGQYRFVNRLYPLYLYMEAISVNR